MLGLKKVPASIIIARDIIKDKPFGVSYESVEECYEDRIHHREDWYNYIRLKCKYDPAFYVKQTLQEGDIFVGHRNRKEFKGSSLFFDYTIWVDASGRGLPPEDKASCDITMNGHDFIIENNNLPDTMIQVASLYKIMKNKKRIKSNDD
jgi:hypothetical protein